jgi:hypothetical protein
MEADEAQDPSAEGGLRCNRHRELLDCIAAEPDAPNSSHGAKAAERDMTANGHWTDAKLVRRFIDGD